MDLERRLKISAKIAQLNSLYSHPHEDVFTQEVILQLEEELIDLLLYNERENSAADSKTSEDSSETSEDSSSSDSSETSDQSSGSDLNEDVEQDVDQPDYDQPDYENDFEDDFEDDHFDYSSPESYSDDE